MKVLRTVMTEQSVNDQCARAEVLAGAIALGEATDAERDEYRGAHRGMRAVSFTRSAASAKSSA